MTIEEASGAPVEIYSDNLDAIRVYYSVAGQWRMGRGGPIALDYNVLFGKLGAMGLAGVKRKHMPEVFEGVQIMADAALEHIHRK